MFYILSDASVSKFKKVCVPLLSSPVKALSFRECQNLTDECIIVELTSSGTLLLDICEQFIRNKFSGQLYIISLAEDERLDPLMSQVLTSYGIDAVVLNGRVEIAQALKWVDEHNINEDQFESLNTPTNGLTYDHIEELIKSNQLTVHYQAQFKSNSLELTGLEALVRLFHDGVPVPLSDVFKVILERDLWTQLTRSVLDNALNKHQELFKQFPSANLAINLSAKELSKHTFSQDLKSSLTKTSITPDRLMFELTENELYSSLSTVSRHLLLLKLDQSFIKNIHYIGEQSVAKSTAEIARTLKMKTVAEGVETADILGHVRNLDIDQVQGFLLHKPQSYEDLMNADLEPKI